jgi:hypothetical protein
VWEMGKEKGTNAFVYSCSACLNSPAWKHLFPCSLNASARAALTVGSGPAILISFFCAFCLVVKMRWVV